MGRYLSIIQGVIEGCNGELGLGASPCQLVAARSNGLSNQVSLAIFSQLCLYLATGKELTGRIQQRVGGLRFWGNLLFRTVQYYGGASRHWNHLRDSGVMGALSIPSFWRSFTHLEYFLL
ncbi:MAG: hypothetical protein KJ950_01055 [Proteobacteria bacterium]|nr:hypothetical protein [Pseudomonadota bacterium]MBU1686245.1 hypothetical protein [Pseudomonadota bacterium]